MYIKVNNYELNGSGSITGRGFGMRTFTTSVCKVALRSNQFAVWWVPEILLFTHLKREMYVNYI